MTMIRIAPAQGRMLRNPDTGERIPAEGALVRRSPYWRRRLQDGDAVQMSPVGDAVLMSPDGDDAQVSPGVDAPQAAPVNPDAKPARTHKDKEA